MNTDKCNSCGASTSAAFFEARHIPVHSCRLVDSVEESLSLPKGDLELAVCPNCGFMQNAAFDPALVDYSESYEDTQAFSDRFTSYADELSDHLIETYDLRGGTVLEIGCGRGDFLRSICDRGGMRGIGFDPAYQPQFDRKEDDGVRIYRDYYSAKTCGAQADLILCRHTLEHIPAVGQFMRMVRKCIDTRPDSVLCFEVPDTSRILEEEAFWDIYYEHCSYFTAESLEQLFEATGFSVLDVRKTYADQYLVIEAKPADADLEGIDRDRDHSALLSRVDMFRQNVGERLQSWRQWLDQVRRDGWKVALWGAGSKAAGFLVTLNVTNEVGCVVDINPGKWGHYQAGTRQRIVSPRDLEGYRPDVVLIMNPIYREEIGRDLEARGLKPELLTL